MKRKYFAKIFVEAEPLVIQECVKGVSTDVDVYKVTWDEGYSELIKKEYFEASYRLCDDLGNEIIEEQK